MEPERARLGAACVTDELLWIVLGAVAVWMYLQTRTATDPPDVPVTDSPDAPYTTGTTVPDNAGVTASVKDFATAISVAEGFGVSGAIPTLAHNPGDLAGDYGWGTFPGSENIANFPDDPTGWAYLYRQVEKMRDNTSQVYTNDMSIANVASHYAPKAADVWSNNVAEYLVTHGYEWVSVDTVISDFFANG